MSPNTLNAMLTFFIAKQRNLSHEKAVVASLWSLQVAGPMGLLVPLVIGGAPAPAGGTAAEGGGGASPTPTGGIRVRVPDVVGENVVEAGKKISEARLLPITSIHYTDAAKKDQVLQQEPEAGGLVPEATKVDLTIAAPPVEEELTEEDREKQILAVVQTTAAKVDELVARRKDPKAPTEMKS